MENKHSGLATPPIVSPRPIQTEKSLSPDESWKIVGSPPRRPLLSPPEDRLRGQDKETLNLETRTRTKARTTLDSFLTSTSSTELDSTGTSLTTTRSTTESSSASSTASSASTPASPTTPQHHNPLPHRIQTGKELGRASVGMAGPKSAPLHQTFGFTTGTSISPFTTEGGLKDSMHPTHIKPSSVGSQNNRRRSEHLPFNTWSGSSSSGMDRQDFMGNNTSFHTKSSSLNNHGPGLGRNNPKSNGSLLDSPLSLSSFIWNDHANKDTTDPASPTHVSLGMTMAGIAAGVTTEEATGLFYPALDVPTSTPLRSDPLLSGAFRNGRTLSFSEQSFSNGYGLTPRTTFGQEDDDVDVLRTYRPPLPTMEEELEDSFEPRTSRARSFSTSAAYGPTIASARRSSGALDSAELRDSFNNASISDNSASALSQLQDRQTTVQRKLSGAWSLAGTPGMGTDGSNHRRSITSTSGYSAPPIWESPGTFQPMLSPGGRDRVDQQKVPRRFSVAPSSGFQHYSTFLESNDIGSASSTSAANFHQSAQENSDVQQAQRRHSVAGAGGSYLRSRGAPFSLSDSMDSLHLDGMGQNNNISWLNEDPYENEGYPGHESSGMSHHGKGMTLGQLPHHGSLYVVEFKAGRSDLFYVTESSGLTLKRGDLVMVEADRGKDLGKITNDSISPQQVQALQAQQAEMAAIAAQQEGHRPPKEIHPKRIFRLAQSTEVGLLPSKNQDEMKAMLVCQTKVKQKKLPMEVVDAEYQWDRRKLTFYFIADRRIDFRELVRDLFKIYKTRIWMYAVSPLMSPGKLLSSSQGSQSPPSPQPQHQHLSRPISDQTYGYNFQQFSATSQQSIHSPSTSQGHLTYPQYPQHAPHHQHHHQQQPRSSLPPTPGSPNSHQQHHSALPHTPIHHASFQAMMQSPTHGQHSQQHHHHQQHYSQPL